MGEGPCHPASKGLDAMASARRCSEQSQQHSLHEKTSMTAARAPETESKGNGTNRSRRVAASESQC